MAEIRKLVDKNNVQFFPVTHINAVVGSDNTSLSEELAEKQDAIEAINVSVDNTSGTPSGSASMSGNTLSFSFSGIKGNDGATGPQGPIGPAGVTSAVVNVDNTSGTPSATATVQDGVLTINISGIKGEQGNSGYTGAAGELEVVNNDTDGGAARAWSAERGKIIAIDVKGFAFGSSGEYSVWVEKLNSFLNANGTESDYNDYAYTAKMYASGDITITPTMALKKWKVFYYTTIDDASSPSQSAWNSGNTAASVTVPETCTAIRIVFQTDAYADDDDLWSRFIIQGAVPYGGAYNKLVGDREKYEKQVNAEKERIALYSKPKETVVDEIEVGYQTNNGFNRVAAASMLLAYRIPVFRPCTITVSDGYEFGYHYGKPGDRSSRDKDSFFRTARVYIPYIEPGWLSINVRRTDKNTVSDSDIVACGLTIKEEEGLLYGQINSGISGLVSYEGVRPSLYNQAKVWRGYNPGNIQIDQDFAIYGDYLFSFKTNGTFFCYKFSTKTRINNATVFDYSGHPAAAQFGKTIAQGSRFPRLYIMGSSTDKSLHCFVISGDDNGYSINHLYSVSFVNIDTSLIGAGGFCTYVDEENTCFYLFRYKGSSSAVSKENGLYVTKFRLPSDESELTENDIIDPVVFLQNFDYYAIQGGFVKNGQVFFAVGIGPYNTTAHLYVYDPYVQKIITHLHLTDVFTSEPQGLDYLPGENALLFATSSHWFRIQL